MNRACHRREIPVSAGGAARGQVAAAGVAPLPAKAAGGTGNRRRLRGQSAALSMTRPAMPAMPKRVKSWLEGLRFPVLLLLTAALFLVNLAVPDPIPFADEALLGLLTLLLARIKRKPA